MASLLFLPQAARTPSPRASTPRSVPRAAITCGPRDNRGPLQRGRSLSTEAIHAVQSLKRLTAAAEGSPSAARAAASASLGRLLRADLLAAMAELQRQGRWALALAALHVARAEPWYRPDPALYATFVSSAPPSDPAAAAAAVDALVDAFLDEKEMRGAAAAEGPWEGEDVYKLTRLVRALVAKGRAVAAWRVYEAAVRRGGLEVDEYMYRVMARGLKRLGLDAEAAEVEADFAEWEARVFSPPARHRHARETSGETAIASAQVQ